MRLDPGAGPRPAQATASRSPAISEGRRSSRAIAEFSQSYADQNDSDYALLTKAVDSGELEVQTDLLAGCLAAKA